MGIGLDAIFDCQACCLGKGDVGRDADANDGAVDLQARAIAEFCTGDEGRARQCFQPDAFTDFNTVTLVQGAEIVGGRGRGNPLQDAVCGLDQRDFQAFGCSDSSGFETDIATADDQHSCIGINCWNQCVDVVQRADREDAGQVTADCCG